MSFFVSGHVRSWGKHVSIWCFSNINITLVSVSPYIYLVITIFPPDYYTLLVKTALDIKL